VVQVMAYNNVGNGPNAQQQEFTLEELDPPADSELLPPLEVKVEILSPTSVMVTWYDNTLGPNQRPLYDNIYTVKYNALSGGYSHSPVNLALEVVFFLLKFHTRQMLYSLVEKKCCS